VFCGAESIIGSPLPPPQSRKNERNPDVLELFNWRWKKPYPSSRRCCAPCATETRSSASSHAERLSSASCPAPEGPRCFLDRQTWTNLAVNDMAMFHTYVRSVPSPPPNSLGSLPKTFLSIMNKFSFSSYSKKLAVEASPAP